MANGDRDGSRLVIGVTGPLGSGVSTTAKTLATHGGFHSISLAHAIKQEFKKREALHELTPLTSVAQHRKKLQDIGNEMRQKSPSYWVDAALNSIPSTGDLVIDGIRNLAEVATLRLRFPRFFLIGIHAPPLVRWNRVKDQYDGNQKTFDRDDRRDSDEDLAYGQQVEKCVLAADYVRVNGTDDGATHDQLKTIYQRIKDDVSLMRDADTPPNQASFRRPPTADEAHMAAAYAEAHISQCLKRHVGAIIVSPDGRALSMGYNENPIPMKPCKAEYENRCYKDSDMERRLEAMKDFFCPKCGQKVDSMSPPWKCPHADCGANLKARFFPSRNMELCTAIHAEERAIRSLEGRNAQGATIFCTTFPCFQCARYIIDAGIKKVVYVEAYPVKASLEFLERNHVEVKPFEGFQARAFNTIFKQVE